MTKNEIIKNEIIKKMKELSPDGEYAENSNKILGAFYNRIIKIFGNYKRACCASGLFPITSKRRIEALNKRKKQWLKRLQEVCIDGIAPSARADRRLASSVEYHFGSWKNALDLIGAISYQDGQTLQAKEKYLEELKKRSKFGIAPRYEDDKIFGGRVAYYFGSWKNAVQEAGLTLWQEVQYKEQPVVTHELKTLFASLAYILDNDLPTNDFNFFILAEEIQNQNISYYDFEIVGDEMDDQ